MDRILNLLMAAVSGPFHLTILLFFLLQSHIWRVLMLYQHILELHVIELLGLRRHRKVL